MSNPNRLDIEASLLDLSDDDAVSVMEGRLPSSDSPAVDEAAAALAKGLLAEPDTRSSSGSGVVRFVSRQPWMRMAAAVVLGIAIANVLTPTDITMSPAGPSAAVTSSNVLFLEAVRGSDTDLPQITLAGDSDWITLIAFPSSIAADSYRVRLERTTDLAVAQLFEDTVGAGNDDSIVVNIPASTIEAGEYRLHVDSVIRGGIADSTVLGFQVQK